MQTDDPASHANLYIHVRILLGMIVGLGLTHLLRHLARIVERPQTRRIYWVHLVWAGFMFVYLFALAYVASLATFWGATALGL